MGVRAIPNLLSPKTYVPLIFLTFLAGTPLITSNSYVLHLLILVLFYAVLSEAWNLLGGFTGQFSLGHSAFFGLSAYTSTLLFISWKISPWLGMFIGAAFAMASGLMIGLLSFRLRGPFFSLITIAFAETLRLLFLTWGSLTGGAIGLLVPLLRDSAINFQFLSRVPYYYVILIMLVVLVSVTYQIRKSRMGLCFIAIREDEDAAQSLGIDVLRYKLIALTISVFFTALAGTFYAQYILYLHPDDVMSLNFSIEIVLPAIIGGMGTVVGPIIGALILTPISEFTRALLGGGYEGVYLILHGGILVAIVIFLPSGIADRIIESYQTALRRMPGGHERTRS